MFHFPVTKITDNDSHPDKLKSMSEENSQFYKHTSTKLNILQPVHSSKACLSFNINDKGVKLLGQILRFVTFSESNFHLDELTNF